MAEPSEAASAAPAAAARPASYVALARRYRPTRLADVIGQEHVTRTLENAIASGRVHHAYLFTGSRGIGKTTVARILARCLNHPAGPTAHPPPVDDHEAELRNAMDVIEIDGASHTGVDDVRALRENARYLPAQARHKIYIIDEVHMLSTSAFNALLKTLEEPPPHVVFVFATTEPHKIPATILSRCQRFDFKRVSTQRIVQHLAQLLEQEGVPVEHGGLALIARAAEGGVRDALSLLDQVIAYAGADTASAIRAETVAQVLGLADRRVLFDLSAALLEREPRRALELVDALFADGHDMAQFAQAFVMHLRDLVVVGTCDQPGPLVEATDAELQELQRQAGLATKPILELLFERFVQAAEQIARSSFPKLLLEMAVIELSQLEPLLPLGDLLDRLESLERRVSGARSSSGHGGEPGGRPSGKPSKAAGHAQGPRAEGRTTAGSRAAPSAGDDAVAAPAPAPAEEARPVPCAPAVEAAAEVVEGDPHARFRDLLGRLRGPWVGIYGAARVISWRGEHLELGFRDDGFALQSAQDPARQAAFCRACEQELAHPLKLTARALTAQELEAPDIARQSAIEAGEAERREKAARLREEALAHPITRALIDELGAKVKQVSTVVDTAGL